MNKIIKSVNVTIVHEFLPFLSDRTNIKVSTFLKFWEEFNNQENHESEKRKIMETVEYTQESLNQLKIKDLKNICEELNLLKKGVKTEIVERILDSQNPSSMNEPHKSKKTNVKSYIEDENEDENDDGEYEVPIKKKTTKKVVSKKGKIDLEQFRAPEAVITQHKEGYWIHDETKIVFSPNEEYIDGMKCRLAIGFEDKDGNIEDLDAEHIELCNVYFFRYKEPINLF